MYNLFISHSWSYSDEYEKVIRMLDSAPYFSYRDYSVPKDDPLRIYSRYYNAELRNKIANQMRTCHVVLILAGVYASYSDSIDMEIEIAKSLNKPIIAVERWGSERTSLKVKQNADRVVGWNTSSIVAAIRELSIWAIRYGN